MPSRYQVPGVYHQPRPRAPAPPPDRTDVVGFVGFEPRVRDGSTGSELIGLPPVGHAFRVDVASFQLVVGGARATVPATVDLVLSKDAATIPIADTCGVVYALSAVDAGGSLQLLVVAGAASPPGGTAAAPDNAAVAAAVLARFGVKKPWLRIADVEMRRAGAAVRPLERPALPPQACDDWQSFVLQYGNPIEDGSILTHALRAFFANGGRRAWVSTVMRPRFDDDTGLEEARDEMIGVPGASEVLATGVERLLLIEEVAVLDVPDLHARRVADPARPMPLPPVDTDACFRPCPLGAAGEAAPGPSDALEPLYNDLEVLDTQARLIQRLVPERWRVLLLLDVPLELDPTSGRWTAPSAPKAALWRQHLDGLGEPEEMSVAALYFPWVLGQERVDAPILELPASPFAAGVIARRDLLRGAHVAPANETLRGVVGLTTPIDDDTQARLYEAPANINLMRTFPGFGVQVWGARTLSSERFLRYLPVRRCLSAIERRMAVALRDLVFEPNDPFVWLRTTQLALDVLVPLFERGAFRAARADQAFYVRCDESINPPESVAEGLLVCEVGVAVAAPAEFVVFRVGRSEGAVEVVE
jgi:hypothetical protein